MDRINSLTYKCDVNRNSKLYEFLATNYDISILANKITAQKNAPVNILSLKNRCNLGGNTA